MAFCNLVTTVAPVLLFAVAAAGQTIVQPGAPGHDSKVLTPAGAAMPPRAPTKADIEFMQGMIHHHSQAVEMTALMPTHTKNKKLLALGQRISISQTDEKKFMKQWLQDRGQPAMAPMDDMDMEMPLMPGMLTKQQMEALAKAKGAEFDRLFLTGMIQHHTGALTMVDDLFAVPATGQDPLLFDFVTDVDNTQSAEIRIMQALLKEKQ
jgi:uncharacterized protein (DUF305 family)